MIKPERSLIFICLAISSAASKLVSKAVLSTFFCLIELPEFISIETRASVGFIAISPEFNLTSVSNIWFNFCSMLSSIKSGVLPLYFFIFYVGWHHHFHKILCFFISFVTFHDYIFCIFIINIS